MIGNHELVGQYKEQKPPLAVLQKVVDGAPSGPVVAPDDDMDVEAEQSTLEGEDQVSNTYYDVIGVIRKRIVFATRPKTLLFKQEN